MKRLLVEVARRVLGPLRAAETLYGRGVIDQNRYYDWLTEEVMARCIRQSSGCIDIGCHAGEMLRQMLERAPDGRHLAFEPLPDFHARLLRNFWQRNVQIFNLALSNEDASVTFMQAVDHPAYSGLRRRRYESEDEVVREIKVQARKLDEVIAEVGLDRVDFIKIDVEGAELLVLEGARKTIGRFKPVIVFECGLGGADYYGTKPEQVFHRLTECGLKVSLLAEYLHHRRVLSRDVFCDHFNSGREYFFIAFP